jgi:hypothetical protein
VFDFLYSGNSCSDYCILVKSSSDILESFFLYMSQIVSLKLPSVKSSRFDATYESMPELIALQMKISADFVQLIVLEPAFNPAFLIAFKISSPLMPMSASIFLPSSLFPSFSASSDPFELSLLSVAVSFDSESSSAASSIIN